MGISTVFTHVRKHKYGLEGPFDKDTAAIPIQELANKLGYNASVVKITFRK